MRTAILHIGVENTGTTYLQHALFSNREKLIENGVLYPTSIGSENHVGLTAFAVDPTSQDTTLRMMGVSNPADVPSFRWGLRRDLRSEVDASSCQRIVFSNEHCSSRLQTYEELDRLRSLIFSICDECTVVVYLRRQDDVHLSIYSTSVRDGWSLPIAMPTAEEIEKRYDYQVLLSRWAAVFGRDALIVRRYGDSDVLDDFLSATNLPELVRPPQRLNRRMNAVKLEFLRQLNGRLSERDRGDIARQVGDADIDGPALTIPPDMASSIMDIVAESNRAVALDYFDKTMEGDPLFGPAPPQSGERRFDLSVNETLDAMAKLWALKNLQSKHLWEHVQKLQKATK